MKTIRHAKPRRPSRAAIPFEAVDEVVADDRREPKKLGLSEAPIVSKVCLIVVVLTIVLAETRCCIRRCLRDSV